MKKQRVQYKNGLIWHGKWLKLAFSYPGSSVSLTCNWAVSPLWLPVGWIKPLDAGQGSSPGQNYWSTSRRRSLKISWCQVADIISEVMWSKSMFFLCFLTQLDNPTFLFVVWGRDFEIIPSKSFTCHIFSRSCCCFKNYSLWQKNRKHTLPVTSIAPT